MIEESDRISNLNGVDGGFVFMDMTIDDTEEDIDLVNGPTSDGVVGSR